VHLIRYIVVLVGDTCVLRRDVIMDGYEILDFIKAILLLVVETTRYYISFFHARDLIHPKSYFKRLKDVKEMREHVRKTAEIINTMTDSNRVEIYASQLLFFKRISDVWDDEHKTVLEKSGNDAVLAETWENYRFQVPAGCHFEDVRNKKTGIGEALQNALWGIDKANRGLLRGIYDDYPWTGESFKNDEAMIVLMEHLDKKNLSFNSVPDDILDIGFTYLKKSYTNFGCYPPIYNLKKRSIWHIFRD